MRLSIWLVAPVVAALTGAGQAAAEPAPRCWAPGTVEAARVAELHTMLMAVTLRCRAAGIEIGASYDAFLKTHKKPLEDAHQIVRGHYGEARKALGRGAYDQYLTRLANFYGSGKTDAATCGSFELVGRALAAAEASRESLHGLARHAIREPRLDAAHCVMTADAR